MMKRQPLNSQSTSYNSREQQLYLLEIFDEHQFDQQQIIEKAIFLTNLLHKHLINAIEVHQVDNQIHMMFEYAENKLGDKFQHLSLVKLNIILKQVKQLTEYFVCLGVVTELELDKIMLDQHNDLKYYMGLDFELVEKPSKFQLMQYYEDQIYAVIKPLFENVQAYFHFGEPSSSLGQSPKIIQNQCSVRTQKKSHSNISKVQPKNSLKYKFDFRERESEITIVENEVHDNNLVQAELKNKYSSSGDIKISCVFPLKFRKERQDQLKICNSETDLEEQCRVKRKEYMKQFSSILFEQQKNQDNKNTEQASANKKSKESQVIIEGNQIILFDRSSDNTKKQQRQVFYSGLYTDAEWLQCEAKKSIERSSQALHNFRRLSLSFNI